MSFGALILQTPVFGEFNFSSSEQMNPNPVVHGTDVFQEPRFKGLMRIVAFLDLEMVSCLLLHA